MIGWLFRRAQESRISLSNTLTKKVERFEPLQRGVVSMYSCGPTVYNVPHIGNLRALIVPDLVRRVFEYAGYRVRSVMNITDFGHLVGDGDQGEDKMLIGLRREGLAPTMENMLALAGRFAEAYKEDARALNVLPPFAMPRASEHVPTMIAYIEKLLTKGYAYPLPDGIYFDTRAFPKYGTLGGAASAEHSRIGVIEGKRDPRDFALWKFSPENGWDAPWGKGFPGWHIECTAMSTEYLGESFDIHTGGVDHIAVHHNNELAQAEAANARPYARFWLHNEFLTIDGKKISKSLGNDVTLADLAARGIHPLALRYWLLTGHYRQQMNFTWEAVEGAEHALKRAWKVFARLPEGGRPDPAYLARFRQFLFDDIDTPKATALMWELIKDERVSPESLRATLLDFDRVFAIGFSSGAARTEREPAVVPEAVRALLAERGKARETKDFTTADTLRRDIEELGYSVTDGPDGQVVSRR
ncbi:cysteine--tRNA ligase [Patescibacteria group bacterium]|nr:cysteine--tRNA ligase [Patescibacteria group bacterium]